MGPKRQQVQFSEFTHWAARYDTWLLTKLTPKGIVFSILFFSSLNSHKQVLLSTCKAFLKDHGLSDKVACYHVDSRLLMTHMCCGS